MLRNRILASLFGSTLFFGTAVAQEQPVFYSITDLGTLGGNNSVPIWVTNSGDVVGFSDIGQFDSSGSPIDHAFRWRNGVMQDLGTLGGNNSFAFGANNEGEIVGGSDTTAGASFHAFLWDRGAITDLGTLVGASGFSYAALVNSEHQIVGQSSTAAGVGHAVLWDGGSLTDLGTLGNPDTTNSFANAINELGQIVGGAQLDDVPNPILGFPPFFAVLWENGVITNLGDGGGGIGAVAFNINNRSQVVGRFAVPDPNVGAVAHANLWQGGVTQDLGVPPGDQDSEANSLNTSGQIVGDAGVGFIESYAPDRALLWENGRLIDLNTLIPTGSGYQLIVAFDVNARGEIVVCGVQQSTGNIHALLLTPQTASAGGLGSPKEADSGSPPAVSASGRRLLGIARRIKSRG